MILPDFLTQTTDEILLTCHRIGLYTLVRRHREGWSGERISEEFPTLPLDLVQKVIAFYQANQSDVDVYVDQYREELEQQAAALRNGPDAEELRRRWGVKDLGRLPPEVVRR